MKKNIIACVLTVVAVLSFSVFASAEEGKFPLQQFGRMAILESGRIKPIDTYARHVLLQFSGKTTYERKPALAWLARVIFTPTQTRDDKVFLINNAEIAHALGVTAESKRRYSFAQLEKGFHQLEMLAASANQIEPKSRSVVENEILRTFENLVLYLGLTDSFSFAVPHVDFSISSGNVVRMLQLPETQKEFTFLEIALHSDLIRPVADSLTAKNSSDWTEDEREIFRILSNMYQWSQYFRHLPLMVIPSEGNHEQNWLSPWDAMAQEFHSEKIKKEIIFLAELTRGYQDKQPIVFDLAAKKFSDSVRQRTSDVRSMRYIDLELSYNRAGYFVFSHIFYWLSFLAFIAFAVNGKLNLRFASFMFLILGFIPHTAGLIFRIIILGRPPVTSLYETFVFVAWMSVLLGIIIEKVNRKWLGNIVGSIAGVLLLIIAGKFSSDGDTMKMLVAVLNSNFWLGIHVPTITMGYAACCVAGIIGHAYIIQAIAHPQDTAQLRATYKTLLMSLGLGLTLSFFGTMLGGIWADQSWGRFWGWDPKENGALLIVIWCIIIFHARIANMLDELGVAAASIFGIVIVAWAWFGVNLLSVGLHSYGFTSGVAAGLIGYVAAQVVFLIAGVFWARKRLKI
ncbi:MAG: cytochrome c biogenesis protein CcsA [Candidatus Omnitrophota bacterium]